MLLSTTPDLQTFTRGVPSQLFRHAPVFSASVLRNKAQTKYHQVDVSNTNTLNVYRLTITNSACLTKKRVICTISLQQMSIKKAKRLARNLAFRTCNATPISILTKPEYGGFCNPEPCRAPWQSSIPRIINEQASSFATPIFSFSDVLAARQKEMVPR